MAMLAFACAALATVAGCGGGGGGAPDNSATTPSPDAGPAATTYANSVVLGLREPQPLARRDAAPGATPMVATPASGQYLVAGINHVIAEFVPTGLAGVRMACVSGRGDSVGTIRNINLGVLVVSAAVLMDSGWQEVDAQAAWSAAPQHYWMGWENCGVKAEGAPSPSSRLVPQADGGYAEDIYDGNPGTNFNTLRQNATAAQVRTMLSSGGWATTDDPSRPLVVTWRAYRQVTGTTAFIVRGEPQASASGGTKGFIALYLQQ